MAGSEGQAGVAALLGFVPLSLQDKWGVNRRCGFGVENASVMRWIGGRRACGVRARASVAKWFWWPRVSGKNSVVPRCGAPVHPSEQARRGLPTLRSTTRASAARAGGGSSAERCGPLGRLQAGFRPSRKAMASSSTRTASSMGMTGRASKANAGNMEQNLWTAVGSSQSSSM